MLKRQAPGVLAIPKKTGYNLQPKAVFSSASIHPYRFVKSASRKNPEGMYVKGDTTVLLHLLMKTTIKNTKFQRRSHLKILRPTSSF
ncbi:hypothetical protein [Paenibacillus favisporus]|uniref:hypothetical protein n=1 Tax=Paenibacillus favisporus TaxID=221028 RepID=UPI003D292138